ncbi:MAG: hypothetical protein Q7T17_00785 [Microbacterium sp.]|nr:hypothetical protein [Microbacterium sp.]
MPHAFAPSGPADRSSTWGSVTEIGGYRLVRKLGEDEHVVTWLARGGDETVVLRVFRDTAPDARIDAELGARERLIGPHVPELIDVATSRAGRPVAVVQAVVGPVLSDVLDRAVSPLRAGHLTTILAPIAALVDAAHEVGATLGRIEASGIRLDSSGAPVVVAFGSAATAAPLPERFRDQEPTIRADRAALAAFGASLAALVHERERDAVLAALAASTDPRALELALFDCAAPLPLESLQASAEVDAATSSAPTAATAIAVAIPAGTQAEGSSTRGSQRHDRSNATPTSGALDRAASHLGLPPGLLAPVDGARGSVERAVRGRLRALRAEFGGIRAVAKPRRAVVLVGAAGLLALAAAVVLATAEKPSASSALDASHASAHDDSGQSGSQRTGADSGGVTLADAPESMLDPAPEEWSTLIGALVDRWISCAPAPDQSCIDAAAHAGSGAAEALAQSNDRAGASDALAALERWASGERHIVVVDRMGAAALVDLLEGETATASLLMVRSEAGWRVRAVMP